MLRRVVGGLQQRVGREYSPTCVSACQCTASGRMQMTLFLPNFFKGRTHLEASNLIAVKFRVNGNWQHFQMTEWGVCSSLVPARTAPMNLHISSH